MSVYEDWSRAGWRAHLPGMGDIGGYVAGLGNGTIHGLAAATADRVPDRVALDVDGEQVTHATLDAGSARVASWLAARLPPAAGYCSPPGPALASRAATWARCGPAPWSCSPTPATRRRNSGSW